MDMLTQYLQKARILVDTTDFYKASKIHLVMGNESCDLDSMISTIALGYFYYQKLQDTDIIPVLNIPQEEFCLRTENFYLLNKMGIKHNLLVFRDNLNLKEVQTYGSLSVSLVDHHTLRPDDQFLVGSVTEIFDHRPLDPSAVWDNSKIQVVIEEVGSCCTLIAQKLLSEDATILNSNLAMLLYYAMVFDTIAFNPEAGRVKELDIIISKKLTKQFGLNEDVEMLFDELWTAHNDVSHLTAKQLLSKDLKIVEGVLVPGLPMTVEEYVKLPNVSEGMSKFCQQKCSPIMVLIGLHVTKHDGSNQVHRDVAIFNYSDTGLVDAVILNLKNAQELKGYDFYLQEVCVNVPNVQCFKQNNVKLTRKHILPLIKDAILKHKKSVSENNA